ncbi:MAG TPA: hypothetical protein VHN80_16690, partial [Kineosporiaceae bacterium]|nr:hypothetical protein [Kineosporiaceae bacterium]
TMYSAADSRAQCDGTPSSRVLDGLRRHAARPVPPNQRTPWRAPARPIQAGAGPPNAAASATTNPIVVSQDDDAHPELT